MGVWRCSEWVYGGVGRCREWVYGGVGNGCMEV